MKKANRHARGERFERKIKKILQEKGFKVYKPVRTKFAQKDVFGLFDLLAYNPVTNHLLLLQLTKKKELLRPKAAIVLSSFEVEFVISGVVGEEEAIIDVYEVKRKTRYEGKFSKVVLKPQKHYYAT